MRALITGATGFLGSRLTRQFVAHGDTVHVVARAGSSYAQLQDVLPSLGVHVIDEQPDSVRRALVAAAPDVVFHLATSYARDHKPDDIAPMVEANLALPLRIVDAMAREGCARLVNTASAWQYADVQTYRPVCLHSAMKHAFETLVRYFVDTGSIDCITLVMHDSYGPGDPRRKIFSLLREHAAGTKPLDMSAGEQLIDLIHVDDAVAAFRQAAQLLLESDRTRAQEVYSVSGGRPLPLRHVVETYLRFADLSVPIRWGARPYHEREVMQPWSGGKRLPGWAPKIDVELGLRDLAREHRPVDASAVSPVRVAARS